MARGVELLIEIEMSLLYEVSDMVSDMVIYTEWNAMDIRNDVNSIIREPRIAAWMRADL